MKLISTYKSIDGLYEHIDDQKGKLKENLVEHEQQVRLSRRLAEIIWTFRLSLTKANS